MSEGNTLAEKILRPSKEPLSVEPVDNGSTRSDLSEPDTTTFLARWDLPVKEGEKERWFPVVAADRFEAARFFAMSCDVGNPRPPVTRVVVVKDVGSQTTGRLSVNTRPILTYTAQDA